VPFYFINLLPTSLLYISILLREGVEESAHVREQKEGKNGISSQDSVHMRGREKVAGGERKGRRDASETQLEGMRQRALAAVLVREAHRREEAKLQRAETAAAEERAARMAERGRGDEVVATNTAASRRPSFGWSGLEAIGNLGSRQERVHHTSWLAHLLSRASTQGHMPVPRAGAGGSETPAAT
jgi:hypothetical protein